MRILDLQSTGGSSIKGWQLLHCSSPVAPFFGAGNVRRGRELMLDGADCYSHSVEWLIPRHRDFDPFSVGLNYTKLLLESSPRDFYVKTDTGSDALWVCCASCSGCSQTSGLQIQLNYFNPDSSVTATPISCSDQRCRWAVQPSVSDCSVR